jgi:glycopeptide antibiotics resistance protein
MLEAVFHGHITFIVVASLMLAVACITTYFRARQKSDRPILIALWSGSVLAAVILTMWSNGASHVAPNCLYNRDIMEPFGELQGQLNVAMFVPSGFFGALVTRRWWPGLAVGTCLSAAIETTQGALPVIGRACDSSDWVANSAGAVIGAVIGFAVVKAYRSGLQPWNVSLRRSGLAALVLVCVIAVLFTQWITIRSANEASANITDSQKQIEAANDAVRQAFGDYYAIRNIQFTGSPQGQNGTVFIALSSGYLQVSWPDTSQITASIENSNAGPETGYPVANLSRPVHTAKAAQAVATSYAAQHYPWGVEGSSVQVQSVGTFGWMVSFRRRQAGVLMPMRLDIEVDPAGRISQFAARQVADPTSLPIVTVTRAQAQSVAEAAAPQCEKAQAGELLAVQSGNSWRPAWRVLVSCPSTTDVVNVDAANAAVLSKQIYQTPPGTDQSGDLSNMSN